MFYMICLVYHLVFVHVYMFMIYVIFRICKRFQFELNNKNIWSDIKNI